jgi:hypothetical protein
MEITPNEAKILLALRTLKPFEKVEIIADQKGRADYFIVTHTFKEILN